MEVIKIDKFIVVPLGHNAGYQFVNSKGKKDYAVKFETILSLVLRDLGYKVEINKIEVPV